jgi:hypothetical protein
MPNPTPSTRSRLLVAAVIGLAAGGLTLYLRVAHLTTFSDFDSMWFAGRAVMSGENPYVAVRGGYHWPLHYPLTAILIAQPFTIFSQAWSAAAWTAVGFALLAYGLTAAAWWPLLGLASYPAVDTAQLAQWSALSTAVASLPWLAFLSIAKPTTAGVVAASYAQRTLRRPAIVLSAVITVVLMLVAFWLRPFWISEWLGSVRATKEFVPLVLRPGGVVLLLALLRWRRPEGRLIALLALVPQTASPYDALPLLLVYSTRREALVCAWLGFAAVPFLAVRGTTLPTFMAAAEHNTPILLVSLYLPALFLLLRRPNVGYVPAWLELGTQRLPGWLRGATE